MYHWYRDAQICYVYLEDIPMPADSDQPPEIRHSRWFTRGWTLQELIAPKSAVFYSADWHHLGTRSELSPIISAATNIEERFLNGEDLERASVSKRMSWASGRKPTRIEDIAYCLLGIFDVNISPLYGEGKKAFRRLQEELMKRYPEDHTLFAWGTIVDGPSRVSMKQVNSEIPVPWDEDAASQLLHGLLAESPRDFATSGDFVPWNHVGSYYRGRGQGTQNKRSPSFPVAIGNGIRLDLPVWRYGYSAYHWPHPKIVQSRRSVNVHLLCGCGTSVSPAVCLELRGWGVDFWGRTREIRVQETSTSVSQLIKTTKDLFVEPQRSFHKLEHGDIIVRRYVMPSSASVDLGYHRDNVRMRISDRVFGLTSDKPDKVFSVEMSLPIAPASQPELGLAFVVSRLRRPKGWPERLTAPISVSLVPIFDGESLEPIKYERIEWVNKRESLNSAAYATHKFKTPVDSWEMDKKPFLPFAVTVDRMDLDGNGASVDVIDIIVRERMAE